MGGGNGAIIGFGVAIIVLVMFYTDIVQQSDAVRTVAATDTGTNCSTGVGETECDFALDGTHGHAGTFNMTVTETSPGSNDRTATSTLGSDRTTVTVAGLTASTAYVFDIDYRPINPDQNPLVNGVLSRIGMVLAVVITAAAIIAVAKA